MEILLPTALLAFGLAEAFFGYRIFRVLVVLFAALLGWTEGPDLLQLFSAQPLPPSSVFVAALAGAAIAGLLGWIAFRLLVALYAFAVGWSLGLAAVGIGWLALVVGLLFAVLALLATVPLIVAATAIHGAWLAVGAGAVLLGWTDAVPAALLVDPPDAAATAPLVLALVFTLAGVGAAVQLSVAGRRRVRRRVDA